MDNVKTCRVCLRKTATFQLLQYADGSRSQYYQKLQEIAPEIDLRLTTQPVICAPCSESASAAHRLRRKLLQTEKQLQKGLEERGEAADEQTKALYYLPEPVAPSKTTRLDALIARWRKKSYFRCGECPYKTTLGESLREHLAGHRPSSAAAGGRPVRSQRAVAESFRCYHCGFAAAAKSDLVVHMAAHKAKPHFCDVCGYATNKRYYLELHVRKHHTHEKPYKCGACPFESGTKTALTRHFRRYHMDQSVFYCHLCPCINDSLSDYMVHMKTHLGAEPVLQET